MTRSMRSLRLYLANKTYVVGVPVMTLGLVVLITVLIGLVMGIAMGLPLPPGAEQASRTNIGPLTALPGFLIGVGVLAMNRNFAMALAFGSARRDFWCGSALGFTATSLVTAVTAVALLAVEKATHGWFVGIHALDLVVLGSGDYVKTFAMILMLSLLSLFLGAMFGTVYRAFGAVSTVVTGIVLAVAIVGLVAVGVWQRAHLVALLADWDLWAIVAALAALVAAAAASSYSANRLATL